MIPERIIHLMDMYQEKLAPLGDGPEATHVYNMCTRMRQLLGEKDPEKTYTWLGFIQCFLWREGIYDLEELKGHNGWRDDANEPPLIHSDPRDVYKVETQ